MRVSSCCGCCSLQNGSIVIGILSLVSGFFSLISLCIFAARIEHVTNPEFRMGMYYVTKSMLAGMIAYIILMLILTFLFIMGIVKRNSTYVFPFLCVHFANIISSVAVLIGYLTYSFIFPEVPPIVIFILFLVAGLGFSLQSYLWLVVLNFYKELVAEKYGHSLDNDGKIYQKSFQNGV